MKRIFGFLLLLSLYSSCGENKQKENNNHQSSVEEKDSVLEESGTYLNDTSFDYLFILQPQMSRDKVSSILPEGEESTMVFPNQIQREVLLDNSTHEIKVVFDENDKVESFSILIDVGPEADEQLTNQLISHVNKQYGSPSSKINDEFESNYSWKIKDQELERYFDVNRKNGYVEYAYIEMNKVSDQIQEITSEDWDQFVNSVYNKDPNFDWFKHGAEDKNEYIYYTDYFSDDYVLQVLYDSSIDALGDEELNGYNTKALYVVSASSGELVGDVLHFIKKEGKVTLVGITMYDPK